MSEYKKCLEEGYLKPVPIAKEKINSILKIIQEDKKAIELIQGLYNTRFKLIYDILHSLAECFILLQGYSSKNHKCLFAFLCEKDEELSWDFFEKIRTKKKWNTLSWFKN